MRRAVRITLQAISPRLAIRILVSMSCRRRAASPAMAHSPRRIWTPRHRTFYLACGDAEATPIIFVHGWPELSLSWRHQLPVFGGLGFRAIAPDMRGYGRSSVYKRHEDYALEHAVQDMLELLNALGREKAVWVGHDWG